MSRSYLSVDCINPFLLMSKFHQQPGEELILCKREAELKLQGVKK